MFDDVHFEALYYTSGKFFFFLARFELSPAPDERDRLISFCRISSFRLRCAWAPE